MHEEHRVTQTRRRAGRREGRLHNLRLGSSRFPGVIGGAQDMTPRIPKAHPLTRLFASLTEENFAGHLGWPDGEVIGYLTDVLTDFVHVDRLFKIRNAQGRRVEEVAEMLAEGDLLHRAESIDREREVHRHIGDYTLFMTGIFPEYLRRLKTSRVVLSPDALLRGDVGSENNLTMRPACPIVPTCRATPVSTHLEPCTM